MSFAVYLGIHECSVDNRGCGGNSLCLVTDGVTGVCSCPTLLATKQGRRRGNSFHDCIGTVFVHHIILYPLMHVCKRGGGESCTLTLCTCV